MPGFAARRYASAYISCLLCLSVYMYVCLSLADVVSKRLRASI